MSVSIAVLVQTPGQLCARAGCHAVPDVQPGPSAGRPNRHRHQAADRHRLLRPGTRLPSIRGFAESHNVSRFTVVEAYDRLVAMGYLQSRRGAGFYTAPTRAE